MRKPVPQVQAGVGNVYFSYNDMVGLVFQEQESENLIEKLFIGRVYW